jgi:hypothetical protein
LSTHYFRAPCLSPPRPLTCGSSLGWLATWLRHMQADTPTCAITHLLFLSDDHPQHYLEPLHPSSVVQRLYHSGRLLPDGYRAPFSTECDQDGAVALGPQALVVGGIGKQASIALNQLFKGLLHRSPCDSGTRLCCRHARVREAVVQYVVNSPIHRFAETQDSQQL